MLPLAVNDSRRHALCISVEMLCKTAPGQLQPVPMPAHGDGVAFGECPQGMLRVFKYRDQRRSLSLFNLLLVGGFYF
jgi:hypothetical protein